MERLNQPSHTECCRGKGKGSAARGQMHLNNVLEAYTGNFVGRKRGTHPSKAIQPRYELMQAETLLNARNPKRTDRQGEVWEGLSGSESMARKEREVRNLGGPCLSRHSNYEIQPGKILQRKEEEMMGARESDRFILAGKGPQAPNRRRDRREGVIRRGNRSSTNG